MHRLSPLFGTALLALGFSACQTIPDAVPYDSASSRDPNVGWAQSGNRLILSVNRMPHEIFRDTHSFDALRQGDFRTYGIPSNALSGAFVMSNAPDESNNHGFYAIVEGRSLIVYGTLYDPGFYHSPNWRRFKRIRL